MEPRGARYGYLAAGAIFIAACLLYLLNIGHAPHPDELYHLLAAKGLLATGEPRIAEGLYVRAYGYTWIIAQFLNVFGESLIVARLPSILAMSAVASLLFLWLKQNADLRAAYIGTALFATSPFAIELAQFARFYGLQTLAFVAGAFLVHYAVSNRHRLGGLIRVLIWSGAAGLLVAAIYLQQTTLLGICGLVLWVIIKQLVPWYQSSSPNKLRISIVAALILIAGLLLAEYLGLINTAIELYRSTPKFNLDNKDNFLFYHLWYSLYYPTLWPAIGLITLAAIVARPAPVFFAALLFFIGLILNSFAAQKNFRYLIYAQPFLFVILGIFGSMIWDKIASTLGELRKQLAETISLPDRYAGKAAFSLVTVAVAFLILGNPAIVRSAALLSGITIPPEKKPVDWKAAEPALKPWLTDADVIVTMAELEMLHFYGQYDLLVSASRLAEIPDGVDFSADFRTGRPVIGSVSAMQKVFDCVDKGVFVSNTRRWGQSNLISDDLTALILENTLPLEMPKGSGVLAFTWDHPDNFSFSSDCDQLQNIKAE